MHKSRWIWWWLKEVDYDEKWLGQEKNFKGSADKVVLMGGVPWKEESKMISRFGV